MHDFICFVREFRVLLSLFLMLCVLHGLVPLAVSAESPAFPSDVQKAIDKSEADISMINAKAAQEEAKVRKALVAVLIKAQEKATKSGNLDAANAIKARVDAENKRMELPDLLATVPLDGNRFAAGIVGQWKVSIASGYQGMWTFTDKGVSNGEGNKGTYKVVKNILTVTWDIGLSETLSTYETMDKAAGTSGHGAALTITRVQTVSQNAR